MKQVDFIPDLKFLHLLLIDLLVKTLKLGPPELFAHSMEYGHGGIFLTINSMQLIDDVFNKLVHLPLIFEHQVHFSSSQSQTDALP